MVFTAAFLGALTLLTVIGAVFAEPRVFFVAFLAVLGWRWYQVLRTPIEIRIRDDESIEFRRLLGRAALLEARQIKRIRRAGRGVWLEHQTGSLNLYGNMRGLSEFVWELKVRNPALQVEGLGGHSA